MRPADIAASSGFSDIRYMNRVFQEAHRCSPEEYRVRHLNETNAVTDAEGSVQSFLGEEESLAYLKEWMAVHASVKAPAL